MAADRPMSTNPVMQPREVEQSIEDGSPRPRSGAAAPIPSRVVAACRRWVSRYRFVGVATALLFLALSMTPSLLPRSSLLQGLLCGITAATGYGIGVGAHALWQYLELPEPVGRSRRIAQWTTCAVLTVLVVYSIFSLVRWQNDLRGLLGMEPVNDGLFAVVVLVIAAVVAVALIGLARLSARFVRAISRSFDRRVPRRISRVLGAFLGVLLLWSFLSGVLVAGSVDIANRAFSIQNGRVDPSVPVPDSPLRSGSPESLIPWDTLGSPGRRWIAAGPTAAEINAFSGGGAVEPIRAYAGLDSAADVRARAQLLLDELIRMGAFDRSVLVLATSTGSGGIDPRGTGVVEYIFNGDTAIAGIQYSFLPSALSFFVDQGAASTASTTMFEVVHGYWRDLDPAKRPELYLFGVSLGSYGSEQSAISVRASGDPIDGAVWAGPTFNNDEWVIVTENRDEGSPAWLPTYDDGTVIRFTADENALAGPSGEWFDDRFVYIQHGSDPVTFFSPDLAVQEPEWLRGERAPDVSKHMDWFPVITFWQVVFDLPMGGSVPPGHGHNFGIPAYVDAWVGVTAPAGWSEADSEHLTAHLVALDE